MKSEINEFCMITVVMVRLCLNYDSSDHCDCGDDYDDMIILRAIRSEINVFMMMIMMVIQ